MSPRRALQRGAALARVSVAALSLTAAGIVGLAVREGYRGEAYHATPHEAAAGVSTLGFGSTRHPDGQPVRPAERTTPERALLSLLADADARQQALRECLGPDVAMYPREWDVLVRWSYNVGVPGACASTLAKHLRAGQHDAAAAQLLRWDRQAGCRLPGLAAVRRADWLDWTGQHAQAAACLQARGRPEMGTACTLPGEVPGQWLVELRARPCAGAGGGRAKGARTHAGAGR